MFIKIAGIILVVSGFGCWGIVEARRLRRRVKQLQELRHAFGFLEKEITCLYSPLTSALENTARFAPEPISVLFAKSASLLKTKNGVTAKEAWLQGLERMSSVTDLQKSDLELLASVAGQLGLSDALQQRKFINLIQEQLKSSEEKAQYNTESEQKLYLYGGFVMGSLVVLLLL